MLELMLKISPIILAIATIVLAIGTFILALATVKSAKATGQSAKAAEQTAKATLEMAISDQEKQKEEKSKFFLEECKGIFNHVVDLLSDGNNKQHKWHSAYFLLEDCQKLMKEVALETHKISLSTNYKVFCIIMNEIIRKITDPRFFLGVPDYRNYNLKKEVEKMHSFQATEPGKSIRDYRISAGRLRFILRFINLDRGNDYKNKQEKPDFNIDKIINNPVDTSPLNGSENNYYRDKGFSAVCEYQEIVPD